LFFIGGGSIRLMKNNDGTFQIAGKAMRGTKELNCSYPKDEVAEHLTYLFTIFAEEGSKHPEREDIKLLVAALTNFIREAQTIFPELAPEFERFIMGVVKLAAAERSNQKFSEAVN